MTNGHQVDIPFLLEDKWFAFMPFLLEDKRFAFFTYVFVIGFFVIKYYDYQ